MENRDEKLRESFEFISKNIDITFDKVPGRLRELWYFDVKSKDDEQEDFAWTVFMYVYLYSKKSKGARVFSVSEEDISTLFTRWQTCIAIAEIDSFTELKIAPFKIFDVESLENVVVQISTKSPHH